MCESIHQESSIKAAILIKIGSTVFFWRTYIIESLVPPQTDRPLGHFSLWTIIIIMVDVLISFYFLFANLSSTIPIQIPFWQSNAVTSRIPIVNLSTSYSGTVSLCMLALLFLDFYSVKIPVSLPMCPVCFRKEEITHAAEIGLFR